MKLFCSHIDRRTFSRSCLVWLIVSIGYSAAANAALLTSNIDAFTGDSRRIGESDTSNTASVLLDASTSDSEGGGLIVTAFATQSGDVDVHAHGEQQFTPGSVGRRKTHDVSASVSSEQILTNSTSDAREYMVVADVSSGFATVSSNLSGDSGIDQLTAQFLLEFMFDGAIVHSTGIELMSDAGDLQVNLLGDNLFGMTQNSTQAGRFEWGDSVFELVLGIISPGASADFSYRLSAMSTADLVNGQCPTSGSVNFCATDILFSSPLNFAVASRAVSGVAEPGLFGILVLGLGLLLWRSSGQGNGSRERIQRG